jgi:hypothetical protein
MRFGHGRRCGAGARITALSSRHGVVTSGENFQTDGIR